MTAHDGRKEGDDSHHEHRSHEIAQGDVATKGKHHDGNSQSGSAADTEDVRTSQGVAEGGLQQQAASGKALGIPRGQSD